MQDKILSLIYKYKYSYLLISIPVSIIISGQFLFKIFPINIESDQILKLHFKCINLQAKNGEVTLGFTAYIIISGFISLFGKSNNIFIQQNIGIDPGQCVSIILSSAVLNVVVSFLLWLLFLLLNRYDRNIMTLPIYRETIERSTLKSNSNKKSDGKKNEK